MPPTATRMASYSSLAFADSTPAHHRGCHHPTDRGQDPVDAPAQFRSHEPELLGLRGEANGVGVGSDAARLEHPGSGGDERSGQHLVGVLLRDGVGITGEERLVDLQPLGDDDEPVHHDLVPGGHEQQVVEHDLVHRDRPAAPLADHRGPGCRQQRQAVKGLFGAQFLDYPDEGVGDEHAPEQSVLGRGYEQDHPSGIGAG